MEKTQLTEQNYKQFDPQSILDKWVEVAVSVVKSVLQIPGVEFADVRTFKGSPPVIEVAIDSDEPDSESLIKSIDDTVFSIIRSEFAAGLNPDGDTYLFESDWESSHDSLVCDYRVPDFVEWVVEENAGSLRFPSNRLNVSYFS